MGVGLGGLSTESHSSVLFIFHFTMADPGGTAGMRPPKGPDSFLLTYKFFET